MENLELKLGKSDKKNKNTGRHTINYNGKALIDLWFGDVFAVKTAKEVEEIANKILETLKNK